MIFFLGFFFFKSDRPTQYQETHSTVNEEKKGMALMEINFILDKIEERDIEVAAQAGRDDISVCTCTGFCLREAERNACPCRSAQQFCTSSCHRVRGTRVHA